MRIRVVGIGTPHGDDAAGPLVIRLLAAEPGLPPGVDAVACGDPLALLELLEGVDAAVLVDATRSGREPGTLHELAPAELGAAARVSSHGLGVREALALSRGLGRAPQRIAIVGIEAGTAAGDAVSPPVAVALAGAAARVRGLCHAWHAGANGSDGAEAARRA